MLRHVVDTVKRARGALGGPVAGDAGVGSELGDQLLRAALESLAHEPAERLSLRRVAQTVGVSHQAPYVHFGDKRRFLAAVAGMAVQEAADQAANAMAAAESDPAARLHALADSYIAFIRNRPHVHDLAYGPLIAKADHPRLQQAAIAYWNLLHDAVAACQPPGTSEADVLRGCAATWGTVYGLARLAALHQIPRSVPSEFDRLIHQALDTLRLGWAQQTPKTDGVATESANAIE
jgi:AcrR family transcriptional regulator